MVRRMAKEIGPPGERLKPEARLVGCCSHRALPGLMHRGTGGRRVGRYVAARRARESSFERWSVLIHAHDAVNRSREYEP